jgi:hypothetical protein
MSILRVAQWRRIRNWGAEPARAGDSIHPGALAWLAELQMDPFAAWRRQSGLLAFLVGMLAFEHVSFAKIPALIEPATVPPTAPLVVHRAGAGSITEPRATRYVECHISHRPLQGPRTQDRACPLLLAESPQAGDRGQRAPASQMVSD